MVNIITEEEILNALNKAKIEVDPDGIYEITNSGFGTSIELPRFNLKVIHHIINGETKVSYVSYNNKINKKTLTYIDKYRGCVKRCCWGRDLVKHIWVQVNKYHILDELKFKSYENYELFKELAKLVLEN